jgi:hypothetical protein
MLCISGLCGCLLWGFDDACCEALPELSTLAHNCCVERGVHSATNQFGMPVTFHSVLNASTIIPGESQVIIIGNNASIMEEIEIGAVYTGCIVFSLSGYDTHG